MTIRIGAAYHAVRSRDPSNPTLPMRWARTTSQAFPADSQAEGSETPQLATPPDPKAPGALDKVIDGLSWAAGIGCLVWLGLQWAKGAEQALRWMP